jgi:cytochrome c peroxidase
MKPTTRITGAGAVLASCLGLAFLGIASCGPDWSDEEKAMLQELRLTKGPATPDPSNRWADSEEAARLGQQFFFDPRFSSTGTVSCATCHVPEKDFQDGAALATGVGTTNRRTMPLAGIDGSAWFFWDGRKDSLWSQALGPLESPVEHGGDRLQYVRVIATHYRAQYERLFGALPDLSGLPAHATPNGSAELWDAWMGIPPERQEAVSRAFANMGKAIAAFERTIQPGDSRFDLYVDAVLRGDEKAARHTLTRDEEAGLRLFIGKANCTQCHNGPMLTNQDFANTGVPAAAGLPEDLGRLTGAREALQDEFNCLGPFSDARPEQCRELRSLHADAHTTRQYKVPSLRNVTGRAPFMHAGQIGTLEAVLDHYNRAPSAVAGETELVPLHLSARELKQLAAFLGALSALTSGDLK